MSTIIMSACWPLQGMNASQKSVLISLADNANDDGVCWPSIKYISERTCLSTRAVQNAIKWLTEHGAVQVSERQGRSTVYTVTPAEYAPPQEMRPADAAPHPRRKCTPPPQEMRGTPADAAPITVKNHQGTVKEPSITPAARVKQCSVSDLVRLDVDKQVAIEFLALRKKKRATLTPLALEGIRREAGRAEMTLDEALRKCVERGWQGFEAAWVANDRSTAGRTPRAEDFKEKQYVGTDESAIGWL